MRVRVGVTVKVTVGTGVRVGEWESDHMLIHVQAHQQRHAVQGLLPDKTGLSAGSTAMTRMFGFCALRNCATPVMVPPVPTPHTMASTVPQVSRQISGPGGKGTQWDGTIQLGICLVLQPKGLTCHSGSSRSFNSQTECTGAVSGSGSPRSVSVPMAKLDGQGWLRSKCPGGRYRGSKRVASVLYIV